MEALLTRFTVQQNPEVLKRNNNISIRSKVNAGIVRLHEIKDCKDLWL